MQVYTSLIIAGLSVAFLHAVLPTHWLPFVLAGRAQQWSLGRTLGIAAIAGGGHVLMTTALGLVIVWTGVTLSTFLEEGAAVITSGILALFGIYYIVSHLRGGGHHHHHIPGLEADIDLVSGSDVELDHHPRSHSDHRDDDHTHDPAGSIGDEYDDHGDSENHGHDHSGRTFSPDTVAVGSLIALLTFSPCEGFLPIYLSALPYGWGAFVVLAAVLAVGTLSGMMLFTGLTYAGVRRMKMAWLEHYEDLVLGSVLILLAGAVYLFHHH